MAKIKGDHLGNGEAKKGPNRWPVGEIGPKTVQVLYGILDQAAGDYPVVYSPERFIEIAEGL